MLAAQSDDDEEEKKEPVQKPASSQLQLKPKTPKIKAAAGHADVMMSSAASAAKARNQKNKAFASL